MKPKTWKVGDEFYYERGIAKILGIKGIWVMARKEGCAPFVISIGSIRGIDEKSKPEGGASV